MPTYDYVCDACDYAFEKFQSMSAKTLRKCPECGKNKLRRLIGTGGGVIFKGSGFYETDYRSDSYRKSAEADKPKSDSGDKKSTGSDSKKSSGGDSKPKKADSGSGKAGSGKKKAS